MTSPPLPTPTMTNVAHGRRRTISGDRRLARGQRTADAAVEVGIELATAEGLRAVGFAEVARLTGRSKATIVQRFGTIERLRLAVVQESADRTRDVFVAAADAPPGLARLRALGVDWQLTLEDPTDGARLLAGAAAEFGAPGVIRDALAATLSDWVGGIEALIDDAVGRGEVADTVDPVAEAHGLLGLILAESARIQLGIACPPGTTFARAWDSRIDRIGAAD